MLDLALRRVRLYYFSKKLRPFHRSREREELGILFFFIFRSVEVELFALSNTAWALATFFNARANFCSRGSLSPEKFDYENEKNKREK